MMVRIPLKLITLSLFLASALYLTRAGIISKCTFANPLFYGPGASLALVAAQQTYYENTIKDIMLSDCARCHSGMSRNLMDYDSLKAYADSGMLWAMVSPGGPMNQFAGNDADTIIAWINSGTPEKPQAAVANFAPPTPPAGCIPGFGPKPFPLNVPLDQITYSNTIKYILAKDCLECHSIPFRNLTTYQNVKYYADNGLLKSLVQYGGGMHRFAGPDSHAIIAWINHGAPQ